MTALSGVRSSCAQADETELQIRSSHNKLRPGGMHNGRAENEQRWVGVNAHGTSGPGTSSATEGAGGYSPACRELLTTHDDKEVLSLP